VEIKLKTPSLSRTCPINLVNGNDAPVRTGDAPAPMVRIDGAGSLNFEADRPPLRVAMGLLQTHCVIAERKRYKRRI
jgi:hypothetical protein